MDCLNTLRRDFFMAEVDRESFELMSERHQFWRKLTT
jgi:hypothetical protein